MDGLKTMTPIIYTLVLLLYAKLAVCMASARARTLVHVKLDGKEMIVTNVSLYLDAFMEVAMALHWLVHVTTPLNGQEDFAIFPFVIIVYMDIALNLVYANVTLVGQVRTARIAFH